MMRSDSYTHGYTRTLKVAGLTKEASVVTALTGAGIGAVGGVLGHNAAVNKGYRRSMAPSGSLNIGERITGYKKPGMAERGTMRALTGKSFEDRNKGLFESGLAALKGGAIGAAAGAAPGLIRGATKAANYEIGVDPSDPYTMGTVAKVQDRSYLGPVALSGLGTAAGASALAGGQYRALTGQSLAGTARTIKDEGLDAAIDNIGRGHRAAMGDAFDAVIDGRGLSNAIKLIDKEKYLKRGLKGALMGGALGAGVNTLSNLVQYGAGHAVANEGSTWVKIKGLSDEL